jgi:hypothetical protein
MPTTTRRAAARAARAGLLAALVVAGAAAIARSAEATLFTAEAMRFALPLDHDVGADDGETRPSENGGPYHYRGEDCARCHVEGGKATNYVFTMAGSIYRDYGGSEPLPGAEIVLEDASGRTVSMTANEEGNFFTYAPLTGAYKAWIRDGERIVPMVTLPKAGSVSAWMSCNMHHTPDRTRGALFVPGGRTLRDPPAADVSYRRHVRPILLDACRPCHLPAGATPVTSQVVDGTTYTYDYSGGLDLTSADGLAARLAASPALVDPTVPERSLLLGKVVIGGDGQHAGGRFWFPDDPDYQVVRQWIVEGARLDR